MTHSQESAAEQNLQIDLFLNAQSDSTNQGVFSWQLVNQLGQQKRCILPLLPTRDHDVGINACCIETAAILNSDLSAALVEAGTNSVGHLKNARAMLSRDIDGRIRTQLLGTPDGLQQKSRNV